VPGAAVALRGSSNRSISVITWIEVLAGVRTAGAEAAARDLLGIFNVLPLSASVAAEAVGLRRERGLKLLDAIILATARAHHLTLVTRNTRDFDANDPGIQIPYRI
jgi:predicted nucleic acid-binding protein